MSVVKHCRKPSPIYVFFWTQLVLLPVLLRLKSSIIVGKPKIYRKNLHSACRTHTIHWKQSKSGSIITLWSKLGKKRKIWPIVIFWVKNLIFSTKHISESCFPTKHKKLQKLTFLRSETSQKTMFRRKSFLQKLISWKVFWIVKLTRWKHDDSKTDTYGN